MIDLVKIKSEINKGNLEVKISYGNILIRDKSSGEAVKIGEISLKQSNL